MGIATIPASAGPPRCCGVPAAEALRDVRAVQRTSCSSGLAAAAVAAALGWLAAAWLAGPLRPAGRRRRAAQRDGGPGRLPPARAMPRRTPWPRLRWAARRTGAPARRGCCWRRKPPASAAGTADLRDRPAVSGRASNMRCSAWTPRAPAPDRAGWRRWCIRMTGAGCRLRGRRPAATADLRPPSSASAAPMTAPSAGSPTSGRVVGCGRPAGPHAGRQPRRHRGASGRRAGHPGGGAAGDAGGQPDRRAARRYPWPDPGCE